MAVKLNYDGIVNVLANPYIEDAMDIVFEYSPFNFSIEQKPKQKSHKRITMEDLEKMGLV